MWPLNSCTAGRRSPTPTSLDQLRNRLLLCCSVVVLLACDGRSVPSGTGPEPELETRFVRIDDAAIDRGSSCEIIDPVWWTGNIYDGAAAYKASLRGFSQNQIRIFALCWYTAEVSNGGHHQFFSNSTGIVWPEALSALEAIGSHDGAAILREAIDRLGGTPPRDREARNDLLDRLEPNFDDLDTRHYAIPDIDAKATAFVRRNRVDFLFEGNVMVPKNHGQP